MQILNKISNLLKSAANSAENLAFYQKLFSIQASSTCKDIFEAISLESNECSQNEIYDLPIFQLESYLDEYSESKVSLRITANCKYTTRQNINGLKFFKFSLNKI